jgi:hypothetical protein
MNVHQVFVTDFTQNEQGISIEYKFEGTTYHYLITAPEVANVLEEIGSEADHEISQFDAIMIVAEHERQKKIKCFTYNTMKEFDDLMASFIDPKYSHN